MSTACQRTLSECAARRSTHAHARLPGAHGSGVGHLDELEHASGSRRLGQDWRTAKVGENRSASQALGQRRAWQNCRAARGRSERLPELPVKCMDSEAAVPSRSSWRQLNENGDTVCPSAARLLRAERPKAPRSALAPRSCEYALARARVQVAHLHMRHLHTHSVVCVSNAASRA